MITYPLLKWRYISLACLTPVPVKVLNAGQRWELVVVVERKIICGKNGFIFGPIKTRLKITRTGLEKSRSSHRVT